MQPAVAILEGMQKDEAERDERRRHDRVHFPANPGAHCLPRRHEVRKILRLGADEMDALLIVEADRLADEILEVSEAGRRISRIDDLSLQRDQVVEPADRYLLRPMQAGNEALGLSRCGRLMLDLETRPGFLGEEIIDRTRQQVGRAALQNIPASLVETPGDGGRDRFGAANGRAIARNTRQVVEHLVARRPHGSPGDMLRRNA